MRPRRMHQYDPSAGMFGSRKIAESAIFRNSRFVTITNVTVLGGTARKFSQFIDLNSKSLLTLTINQALQMRNLAMQIKPEMLRLKLDQTAAREVSREMYSLMGSGLMAMVRGERNREKYAHLIDAYDALNRVHSHVSALSKGWTPAQKGRNEQA